MIQLQLFLLSPFYLYGLDYLKDTFSDVLKDISYLNYLLNISVKKTQYVYGIIILLFIFNFILLIFSFKINFFHI